MTASLAELKTESRGSRLILGDSGAGKTTSLRTIPGKVYIADFDNKISSLVNFSKQDTVLAERIKQGDFSYDCYAPMKNYCPGEAFNDKLGEFADQIKKGEFKYDAICIDSLTLMVDAVMKYLIRKNSQMNRTKTHVVIQPALADYQLLRIFLKELLTEILNFPCLIVVTAHLELIKDEKSGEVYFGPMFPGKLAKELPIYFEEVYRAYVNKAGVHCWQTKPEGKYTVIRSQIPGLKAEVSQDFSKLGAK